MSNKGGQEPVWSPGGGELFYLEGSKMMAVAVAAGPTFTFKPAIVVFDAPYFLAPAALPGSSSRSYDVAPDGRFLMIPLADDADAASRAAHIVVVQNWQEEVKRLVGVR